MLESEPRLWKNKEWWTSHYNYVGSVREHQLFTTEIELHDVTLRDGEQTPGVVFTRKDKVDIALKLDEARVHRIEAGMPVVSEEDKLAITDIAKQASFSRIFSFCRVRKEDVDAAAECGVSSVVMEIPALPDRLRVMGMTVESAAQSAVETIEYAKSRGLFVVFFPYDTTRTDFEAIKKMVKAGEEAHADRIAVVDTVGGASPDGFRHLVSKVREITKVPLEVHCHNTLSLGVANTIAGLCAGAKAAHAAVNGIGEGAGNVALEELVVAMKLLYGKDLGVDLKKLREVSLMVEKYSGIPLPVNKPVFGKNLFRRESGIVVERYYKMPEVARELELFDPAWFAGETEVVLGKKSGKYSVLYALRKRGLNATDEQVKEVLDEVKATSIAKRGFLSEEELDQIIGNTLDKKS